MRKSAHDVSRRPGGHRRGVPVERGRVSSAAASGRSRDSPPFPARRADRTSGGRTCPAEGWPKDLTTLPGHEGWTFGAGQSVFAREPEPRVRAPARRAAGDRAPAQPEDRPERRVPDRPSAVARCDDGEPAGQRRDRRDCGRRHPGVVEGGQQDGRGRALGAQHAGVRRAGQPDRIVDAVGLDDAAAALRRHQPVRRAEARLDPRRPQARHLQDDERRQADRPDDRHLRRARQRRQALQPSGVPGLVPGRRLRGRRRLQRHARRRVRQGREVRQGVGPARRERQGDAPGLLQQRARHRDRPEDATASS